MRFWGHRQKEGVRGNRGGEWLLNQQGEILGRNEMGEALDE